MNNFLYFLGFFLAAAIHLMNAVEIGTMSLADLNLGNKLGSDISHQLANHVENHMNMFLENVSEKVVNKLEDHLDRDDVAHKMLVLLEDDAQIFDLDHYQSHNPQFLQVAFFKNLRERFNNSNFMKKFKHLKTVSKKKLLNLYKNHKNKIKHFFHLMLKALIIPRFVRFVKKNIGTWKANTLKALKKVKGDVRTIAQPIIERLYLHVEEKIDDLAIKNNVEISENEAIEKIAKDEKEIEQLEKEENAIISKA